MSKRQKKNGNKAETKIYRIILITAIIELITAIINLIVAIEGG